MQKVLDRREAEEGKGVLLGFTFVHDGAAVLPMLGDRGAVVSGDCPVPVGTVAAGGCRGLLERMG